MATETHMSEALELGEIQGLVLSSYGDRPAAVYAIFHVVDRTHAQAWLARMIESERFQFSDFLSSPRGSDPTLRTTALNIAFTHSGLDAMGLPPEALAGFSDAFQEGMDAPARARQLGDDLESAPTTWRWGNARGESEAHGVLTAFGGEGNGAPHDIDALERLIASELTSESGLRAIAIMPAMLLPSDQAEHFGFRDGISNPVVRGVPYTKKTDDILAAGEFLLGYRNGYEELGLTPRVRSERDPKAILPSPPDDTSNTTRDFGRNGSFLVFRQLEQKVDRFNAYIARAASELGVTPEWIGAKLVGRWKNGMPLTLDPEGKDPRPIDAPTHFTFSGHGDATGARCPIGSHIRRTNPRDTMLPEPHDQPLSGDPHIPKTREDRLALTNRRRMLRRGRIYQDGGEKGLFFLCFNGNIRRQFEFVQSMWALNPNFAGLERDPDPFLGAKREHPYPADRFTLQGTDDAPPKMIEGLERFVETRGGAYFFMPGKRALKFLSQPEPSIKVIAPNETRDAESSATLHANKVEKNFEAQTAPKHAVRAFHVKSHGIVRAKVTVRPDLPLAYRHGVFAEPGKTFDAWARLSSSAFGKNPDTKADVHGIALKLVGVSGERAADVEGDTQDFLMIDSPYLMVGTIARALAFDRAHIAGGLRFAFHLVTHPNELGHLLEMLKKPLHPLAGTYSSVAPFRLGPTKVVRWGLRAGGGVDLVSVAPSPNHLREALRKQFEVNETIALELCVEVRGAGDQPIDDGSVDWKGSIERIADVMLLREGFDTEEQEALGEAMSFNPWNAIEAHRPLGNLNRARRIVYRAVYEKRTALNKKT